MTSQHHQRTSGLGILRRTWNRISPCGVFRVIAIAGLLLLAPVSGCLQFPGMSSPSTRLIRFNSEDEFKSYLADQAHLRSLMFYQIDFIGPPVPMLLDLASPAPMPAPGATPADGTYSTTNIQEAGVDESDVVKNDDQFIYIAGDREVHIVRAIPVDQMVVVSTIPLADTPHSLYLQADRLIALSQGQQTVATIVNIQDRSHPQVEATVTLGGALITSRLIGNALHTVLEITPTSAAPDTIARTAYGDLLPDLSVAQADGMQVSRDLVSWQDCYRPVNEDGYGMTAVVTLDVERPADSIHSTAIVADACVVYASREALYIANNAYDFRSQVSRESTEIYKFRLEGTGASPVADGEVPGRILNRFSLGEHEGYLCVATTQGQVSASGNGTASNNVYVLGEAGGELSIVGRVEDIAPGEQIYAARFIGRRGFLVTFKKVDPLYTLDLSDPTAPRVVGQLKVPGYSEYIHPLGENHLLTIGKDAVDMGGFAWYQGVQLSIFDVSDFANPRLVDAEIIGDRGTESEALSDPHAFNYFAPAGMLAIPLTIAEGAGPDPSRYGTPTFRGLCLFRVSPETGIDANARIPANEPAVTPFGHYKSTWIRGLFIGNHIFAATPGDVRAAKRDDPNSISVLALP